MKIKHGRLRVRCLVAKATYRLAVSYEQDKIWIPAQGELGNQSQPLGKA